MSIVDADTGEIVRPDALLPARGELSPVALVLPDDLSFDGDAFNDVDAA